MLVPVLTPRLVFAQAQPHIPTSVRGQMAYVENVAVNMADMVVTDIKKQSASNFIYAQPNTGKQDGEYERQRPGKF